MTPGFCECFSQDKACDNQECPMRDKNARYISAYNNYRQKRSEFFKTLFNVKEKN
jgi:hypothetical protein